MEKKKKHKIVPFAVHVLVCARCAVAKKIKEVEDMIIKDKDFDKVFP